MNKILLPLAACLVLGLQTAAAPAVPAKTAKPAPKPALACGLFVPEGGRVVTELSISDADVLGAVKLMLSKLSFPVEDKTMNAEAVCEAIKGVKSVSAIVVHLPKTADPVKVMKGAEAWAATVGKFTRSVNTVDSPVKNTVFLAEEGDAGYVAFSYDAEKREFQATRVKGAVDVRKLVEFAAQMSSVVKVPGLQGTSETPTPDEKTPAPAERAE